MSKAQLFIKNGLGQWQNAIATHAILNGQFLAFSIETLCDHPFKSDQTHAKCNMPTLRSLSTMPWAMTRLGIWDYLRYLPNVNVMSARGPTCLEAQSRSTSLMSLSLELIQLLATIILRHSQMSWDKCFWIPNLIALTRCPAMSFYLGNRENNVQTSCGSRHKLHTLHIHSTHTLVTLSWNDYIPLCPAIGISQIKQLTTSTKSWASGLKWSRWHAVLDQIAVPTGCRWRCANEPYRFHVFLKQCRPSHPWDLKNSACGLGPNLNHGGKRPHAAGNESTFVLRTSTANISLRFEKLIGKDMDKHPNKTQEQDPRANLQV